MSAKNTFSILGAVVVIWAILGFMDVGNFTYTGYVTDFDNNVATVTEGGPADAAGMEVGDKIVSFDGISSEDVRALSSQPRTTVGQTQTIVVDRGGQPAELRLTVAAQPSSQSVNAYIGILTGLAFLIMGLWAYFTVPTPATTLLAGVGVLFGLPFTGGPYLGTSMVGAIIGAVLFMCIVLGFAKLLHFMIVFPNGAEPDKRWVYGPALLVGVFLAVLTIFQPDATSGLNRIVQVVFALWILGYLGLTLVNMVRTWSGASADERSRHGLSLLLVGCGLGIGLLLVGAMFGILLPTVTLPGAQWWPISLILVPISCALAAVKSGRAGGEAAPVAADAT